MIPYGIVKKLLTEEFCGFGDVVLIESPFKETTRLGQYLRSVVLALTPTKFIIATNSYFRGASTTFRLNSNRKSDNLTVRGLKIQSMHFLDTIKLTVFKKTLRQALKVCFYSDVSRYFELGDIGKRKIFWELWCSHVIELNSGSKMWPFSTTPEINIEYLKPQWNRIECIQIRDINNQNEEDNRLKWTDKHLYLGSKREAEDMIRPTPTPGLGQTEEIHLHFLKSPNFGSWDQSEHWVLCGESTPELAYDSNVYTYTGEPTSNVTYTSLMTTDSGSEKIEQPKTTLMRTSEVLLKYQRHKYYTYLLHLFKCISYLRNNLHYGTNIEIWRQW